MSIPVSQQFRDNIYTRENRWTVADVTYTLAAPDSKEGGTITLPPGHVISRPHQIMNEIRRQVAPVLTWEPDGVTLDGRFMIPPDVGTQPQLEIGWWSEMYSNHAGALIDIENTRRIATPSGISTGRVEFSPNNVFMGMARTGIPRLARLRLPNNEGLPVGWRAMTGAELGQLPTLNGRSLAFSPDGNYVAVGADAPTLLWFSNAESEAPLIPMPPPNVMPTTAVWGVAFSPNGKYLACTQILNPGILIYDISSGTPIKLPDPNIMPGINVRDVVFSSDSTKLYVVSASVPTFSIYDISTGTPIRQPNPTSMPPNIIWRCVLSPDNKEIALISANAPFLIRYSLEHDIPLRLPDATPNPSGSGRGVAYSPDGRYLVVLVQTSPFVIFYDLSSGHPVQIPTPAEIVLPLTVALGDTTGIAFSPDGRYLGIGFNSTPFMHLYDMAGIVIEREFPIVQTFNTLGIVFDEGSNNYCTDFDIEFYDAFGNFMLLQEIRDNDTADFRSPQGGIDISKVRITLYKTHLPYRFVRIIELDFGLVLTFDNELISVTSMSDSDPSGKALITPKLDITIANGTMIDEETGEIIKEWDLFDERTKAPFLLRRQRMEFRVGLKLPDGSIEWVHCGTFFYVRSEVSDSRVRLIGMGDTFQIENTMFFESSFTEFPLGTLVRKFYPRANVPIASPPIIGYFGNINFRRALTYLIELSCCIVYEDRNNFLQFVDYTEVPPETTPVDDFEYGTLIGKPVANQPEYYNAISLAEWDTSLEYRQVSRTRHATGHVHIPFNNPVQYEAGRTTLDYEITPGFELQNALWYTMYVVGEIVKVDPDVIEDRAEITIHGNNIILTRSDIIYHAPWYTGLEELRAYPVVLPFFIREAQHFEELKKWFLERKFNVINKQLFLANKSQGNPAREIADLIDTQFTRAGQRQNMNIIAHKMMYSGGFRTRVELVGENPLLIRR